MERCHGIAGSISNADTDRYASRWDITTIGQEARLRGIGLTVRKKCLLSRGRVPQVGLSGGIKTPLSICRKLRDGDGRQDADDGNDDHQLDQSETFFPFSELPNHSLTSFFFVSLGEIICTWFPLA